MRSVPWLIAAVGFGVVATFTLNVKRSPKRLGFAALRTVSHLLFGAAVPAAALLLGGLAAPHGMSQLSNLAPALCSLNLSAVVGYVLLRWAVVPRVAM